MNPTDLGQHPQQTPEQLASQTPSPVTLTLISRRVDGQTDRTGRTVRFAMNADAFQVVDTATNEVVYEKPYAGVLFSAAGTGKRPIMRTLGGSVKTGDILMFELLPTADAATRRAAWVGLVNELRQRGMSVHSRLDARPPMLRGVEQAQRTIPFLLIIATVPAASPVMGFGAALFWAVLFGAVGAGILEIIKRALRKRAAKQSS